MVWALAVLLCLARPYVATAERDWGRSGKFQAEVGLARPASNLAESLQTNRLALSVDSSGVPRSRRSPGQRRAARSIHLPVLTVLNSGLDSGTENASTQSLKPLLDADRDLVPREAKETSASSFAQKDRELVLREAAEDAAFSSVQKAFGSMIMTDRVTFIPGLGMMGDVAKILALCAVCAIAIKMLTVFCSSKRGDVRRCRMCGSLLLCCGIDEFETFEMVVTVHRLQDMAQDGLLGGSEYRVSIKANWSTLETTPTSDCSWDQTKSFEVPQGASEIEVSLHSVGKWKDSTVASCILETAKDMLDEEEFFGKQQKLRLESKGKLLGSLLVTFRQKGDGAGGAGGGGLTLPIAGVNEESALAIAVHKEWEEMCSQPNFKKPESKLQGDQKLFLLSQVLSDDLRDVSDKGKEQGKIFVRMIRCNYAELQGDHREEEMEKQQQKAKKKGLSSLPRKWYWCWYEDRKAAEKFWTHPDGFIPLATITGAHREPKRNDEFVVKYSTKGGTELLRYRRESGKGLDVWIEGLELAFSEARTLVKQQKEGGNSPASPASSASPASPANRQQAANNPANKEEEAFKRMYAVHQHWVQHRGAPKNQAEWKGWFDYLKQSGHDDATISKFWKRLQAHAQAQGQAGR